MRTPISWRALFAVGSLLACAPPVSGPAASLSERNTPAFAKAASLHATEMASLPSSASAGLWVVEDSQGNLVASGVLRAFPTTISSEDYGTVVPGAAGLVAREFGFARTTATWSHPALRVAYVTLGSSS